MARDPNRTARAAEVLADGSSVRCFSRIEALILIAGLAVSTARLDAERHYLPLIGPPPLRYQFRPTVDPAEKLTLPPLPPPKVESKDQPPTDSEAEEPTTKPASEEVVDPTTSAQGQTNPPTMIVTTPQAPAIAPEMFLRYFNSGAPPATGATTTVVVPSGFLPPPPGPPASSSATYSVSP